MPTFPRSEADIIALAQTIAAGITAHATTFPTPPVIAADLTAQINEYFGFRDAQTNAEATLKQIIRDKNDNLAAMIDMMKSDIAYAEMLAKGDNAILSQIGWSGRAPATPLQPPGQTDELTITNQGEGWVALEWKEPSDGGKPASYKVQSRKREGTETFHDVGVAVIASARLDNQPRAVLLEYRIIAINKAGEGMSSNTVSITL